MNATDEVLSKVGPQAGIRTIDAPRLSRRDYIVLPLLSLITIGFLVTACEVGARIIRPRVEEDSCLVRSSIGVRFRPNCTSPLKAAEGPWTTDHYNECGYRTMAHCGPKPAGTVRIVLLGSSMTHGSYVPYDETFAARMGDALARDLKRPAEIENLGVFRFDPLDCYRRLGEAMKLDPDAVVFPVAPTDLQDRINPKLFAQRDDPGVAYIRPPSSNNMTALQHLSFRLRNDYTSVLLAQYFLFRNTDTFIQHFLAYGEVTDYLRQPFTPAWEARFADLQTLVDEMAERLRARGIPLVLVALPSRVEAALLQPQRRQPRVDAFAFGNRLQRIAGQSGASYVDLVHPFSKLPRPESLYFVVNSHLTAEGHAAVARQLSPAVERVVASRPAISKTN
jgi:hypothetical protein